MIENFQSNSWITIY